MNTGKRKKIMIITIIIVSAMVLTPILSIVLNLTSSTDAGTAIDRDFRNQVDNESALKIIDMYNNINSYKDEEVTMELQFFLLEGEEYEDKFSLGVFDTLDNGEEKLFHILAQTEDNTIPEGLNNYDSVKVEGIIHSYQKDHDDHTFEVPIITVKNIEIIENQDS